VPKPAADTFSDGRPGYFAETDSHLSKPALNPFRGLRRGGEGRAGWG